MLSSEIVSGVWGLYGRKGRVWKSKHRGPIVGLPVPLVVSTGAVSAIAVCFERNALSFFHYCVFHTDLILVVRF